MGAKKLVKKTSETAAKKQKRKTAKKKITISSKKISKVSVKKTTKKQREKTAKKKILSKKPVVRKLSRKRKKKPIRKIMTTKKPPISQKRVSKKSEHERKIALRKLLINKREEILREAKEEISKYIKGETSQLVETALDDGDWSIINLIEDINLRQLSTHKETLLKIDEALRKLDEGTYGTCEECGDAINEARLKVMPFAIYCIDCQEKREHLEKIETANIPH